MKIALLLLLMSLAACGASHDIEKAREPAPTAVATFTASPPYALTHAAFVAALNHSCAYRRPDQKRLMGRFEALLERGDLPAAGRVYRQMFRLLAAHVERIRTLAPPPADRAAFERYMAAQQRILGLGERIQDALHDADATEVARLTPLFARETNRRLVAAVDLGTRECGK